MLMDLHGIFHSCLGAYYTTMEEIIIDHNQHRRNWVIPEFAFSFELSEEAEEYAKHLATLNIPDQTLYEEAREKNMVLDQMDYPLSDPEKEKYTENICEFRENICVKYWTVEGAISYGVSEELRTKHEQSLADKFSAISWMSSSVMAIGYALKDPKSTDGRKILVARYSPPGNQPGKYKENIRNTEFIDYFTLDAVEEPEIEIPSKTSEGSRDGGFWENRFFIIPLVLIILCSRLTF
ncbi:uncharacterized protein LOC108028183 isoform X2 [Drosophila biarmipes]|uniref:uncharacterized protein LOC108028183 isoform X2 n=1 Tax=Drosophila biarmipes TaxID=125945 RepID=UPI0007E8A196|nr:uncharacterized protein LOC108028183 isoform X2 [Drosophila biarmipes]